MKPNAHWMFSAAFAADHIDFVLRHYVYPLANLLSRIEQVRSTINHLEGQSALRIVVLNGSTLPYATAFSDAKKPSISRGLKMERVRRVELPTLCLASIRSSQLSYTRITFRRTRTIGCCQFTYLPLHPRDPRLPQTEKLQVIIYPRPESNDC